MWDVATIRGLSSLSGLQDCRRLSPGNVLSSPDWKHSTQYNSIAHYPFVAFPLCGFVSK